MTCLQPDPPLVRGGCGRTAAELRAAAAVNAAGLVLLIVAVLIAALA